MVKDPVCGMQVDEQTAKRVSEFAGIKYYFCSDGCKKKFAANPANSFASVGAAAQ